MTADTIRTGDDPVLRNPARPVTEFGAELGRLERRLRTAMRSHHGVGIAAPQIGVGVRAFVISGGGVDLFVVNPTIDVHGTSCPCDEGCLSLSDATHQVWRHPSVLLRGQQRNGRPLRIELVGYSAQIAQHETDHLDGLLIDDCRARRTPA